MSKLKHVLNLFSSILLLSGLAGCFSGTSTTSAISPTETQQSLLLPTLSNVSGDASSPTNNNQPLPDSLVTKCIKLDNGFYPPVETGNHVLLLREAQAPYPPYLLNLANGIKTLIYDNDIVSTYVSPNQERLAYNTYSRNNLETNELVIANPDGNALKNIPMERDWAFFWGWLDNDHLMVTRNAKAGEQTPALVVLGLSDNSRQEIKSDYPNFDNVNYLLWQHNRVVYNSSLTLALYPFFSGKPGAITLFDIRAKKELAILSADINRTAQPEWSPDGNYLVISGVSEQNKTDQSEYSESYNNQELFLISKNGDVVRLTNFTDTYDNVRIGSASWSPNGKNVAFWFSIAESANEQLATINLDTKEIVNYCVTGINNSLGYSEKPIWSPDSQLLIVNNKENQESPNKVIWIDIKNLTGSVMDVGSSVEGWLYTQ